MKTIIFDTDGTLTDIWPIEKSVLLRMLGKNFANEIEKIKQSGISDTYKIFLQVSKKRIGKNKYYQIYNNFFSLLAKNNKLPKPVKYSIVNWIIKNKKRYHFVYATGGQNKETRYVLDCLKISKYFDFKNSLDKNNCRFSKRTGLPFKKIKLKFPDCILITDNQSDCDGAIRAGVRFAKIKPGQKGLVIFIFHCYQHFKTGQFFI